MSAAIMSDAAIPTGGQKKHLILKSVGTQRPAVAKDNGLSSAPVFEVDLRSVFCRECVHISIAPDYRAAARFISGNNLWFGQSSGDSSSSRYVFHSKPENATGKC